MYSLVNGRALLGTVLGQGVPSMISAPVLPAPSPEKAAVLGVTLLYAGMGAVSTLFSYGVAQESKSKMVRNTGYILAGVAALGTLAALVGGTTVAAMAGDKR